MIDSRFVTIAVALLFSVAAFADQSLTPHIAEYKVQISVLRGRMSSRLDWQDGAYVVTTNIRPTGLARLVARGSIQERSRFDLANGRVRPTNHSGTDTLTSNGQDVELLFDWSASKVVGRAGGERVDRTLRRGAVDRTSLQYAIMFDLLNDRIRSKYYLQEASGEKTLTVTTGNTKTVKVPFGEFEVVGITHASESSSRSTTLWCAQSLGYLPVVIEQYRDGKLKGRVVLSDYRLIDP